MPRRPSFRVPLLALLLTLVAGCDDGFPVAGSETTIAEEAFVTAMAELLFASARWEDGRVPEPERTRILEARGLEAADLERYAQVHGTDVPHMQGVWVRVDSAVTAMEAQAELPGQLPPEATEPGEGSGEAPE